MSEVKYDFYEEMMHPYKLFFEDETRDGFYVWTMMKRFWAAQLKVLAEIDKVCKKHGLRWFADNGTLLGAVRHGGFIPWDDDMDISMLRDDYEALIKYAKDELPEGYEIKSIRYNKDHEQMLGRIINTHYINYNEEHLEKHFGCPYLVGVDIFPLDGVYDEESKEIERRDRVTSVANALTLIEKGEKDSPLCRSILADIERREHTILHRKEDIVYELKLLCEDIMSECPTDKVEYVASMPFWVKDGERKYPRRCFDNTVYMPFEYVHMPVPIGYSEVLKVEYFRYMKTFKCGGAHDYPLYKNQEELLKDMIGENPLRFTMPKEAHERTKTPSIAGRFSEIETMLKQVHVQIGSLIDAGNAEGAGQLLEGCRNLISSVLGFVKDRDDIGDIRKAIDAYKELTSRPADADTAQSLDDALVRISDEIKKLLENRKREVLFLPVKAEWWNTMEPQWKKECANEENDVYVMPLLYLEKDFVQDNGEEINDGELLPDCVNIVKIEDYDIAKRLPDRVYIQDPYDGFNTMIAVPSYFYSKNLLNFTDELVYLPCYDVDDPRSDNDSIMSALEIMVEQPAVYYADKIVVKTEKIKSAYEKILSKLTGEALDDYWSGKIYVTDADVSGYDNLARIVHRDSAVPKVWESKLAEGKKKLLYQINCSFIIENGQAAIDKIRESLKTIEDAKDSLTCIFSPHETIDQLTEKMLEPELYNELQKLLAEIKNNPEIIYDEAHDADEYWNIVDAYYGNGGNIAHNCIMHKIPTMLMAIV